MAKDDLDFLEKLGKRYAKATGKKDVTVTGEPKPLLAGADPMNVKVPLGFKWLPPEKETKPPHPSEVLQPIDSVGAMSQVLNAIRTGEFAVGGAMQGLKEEMIEPETTARDVLKAMGRGTVESVKGGFGARGAEPVSPSEALEIDSGALGLATDILLDPTTYITAGAGKGIALATEGGGKVVLNRAGTKALEELTGKFGEKVARFELAKKIAKEGTGKFVDTGGLKFAGKTVIPEDFFRYAKEKAIGEAPWEKEIAKAFDPYGKIRGIKPRPEVLPEEVVSHPELYREQAGIPSRPFSPEEFIEIDRARPKKMRFEMAEAVEEFKPKAIEATKSTRKLAPMWWPVLSKSSYDEAGIELTKAIEEGVSRNKVFEDLAGWVNKEHAMMAAEEVPRGLLKRTIDNQPYLRHYITTEMRHHLDLGGEPFAAMPSTLKKNLKQGFQKGRKWKGTIKQANEWSKKKHGFKMFEDNAFKAYTVRKLEHIKAVNTYDYIKEVEQRFGTPGNQPRIIDGMKYVPYQPTGKIKFYPVETAKGDIVPGVSGKTWSFLVPEPVAKHLDQTVQILKGDPVTSKFLKTHDTALGFWKGSVTVPFPAFHTRNFMGGSFNNWLAGVNPMRYGSATKILDFKNLDKVYVTELGKKYTGGEILKMGHQTGALGQSGFVDLARQLEKEVARGPLKAAGDAPRMAMTWVEDHLRLPLFMDRILKGDTPDEAARWVFKYHFDYSAEGLSAFERNWMKRLVPFYVWARNNVPLQIEQVIKQPGKYATTEKVRQSINKKRMKEEYGDLPDFAKSQLTFPLPEWAQKNHGKSLWMTLDLPVEDLNYLPVDEEGFEKLVGALNPLLKFGYERYSGESLFGGYKMWDKDKPRFHLDEKTGKLHVLQHKKVSPHLQSLPKPIKDYLMMQELPSYRQYGEEKKIERERGKKYSPTKEGYKKGPEIIVDYRRYHALTTWLGRYYHTYEKTTDKELPNWRKLSQYVLGVPVREFDLEEQRGWGKYREEKEDQWIDLRLKKMGERPYAAETKTKKKKGTKKARKLLKSF